MSRNEVSFVSLCCVFQDRFGNNRLWRLADVENNKFLKPCKSERPGPYFENREWLFITEPGEHASVGSVGIWKWRATQNDKDQNKDYIESSYIKGKSPVRIVIFEVKSPEEVVELLRNGSVPTCECFCDTIFCYEIQSGEFAGVLLHVNEFEIIHGNIQIKNNICSLPYLTIQTDEIYTCRFDNSTLHFFNGDKLNEPSKYITIVDINKFVRDLVLDRATRKTFLENIGGTRADWQNCRKLLGKICEDSLYDDMVQKLKCTEDEAKRAVASFIQRANEFIEIGNIDEDIFAQIAMHNDEFRIQREKIIESEWNKVHDKKIAEIKTAEEKVQKLQEECAEKEKERDNLIAEIDKYEALGKNTLEAIRQKIAKAQEDVAGYIAKLSLFLPHTRPVLSPGPQKSAWHYVCSSDELCADCDIEEARTWQDEVDVIHDNLANSLNIAPEFVPMLSAFLYSSYVNNVPMLIAGPCGYDIANLLSVSLFGSGAGRLILGDEQDDEFVEKIQGCKERILSIQNMFAKGWSDELPQTFCNLRKSVIWTHPYVEDMSLEPKGLYNYMLPLLSECFIGTMPSSDFKPIYGKRAENFEEYCRPKDSCTHIKELRRLGLSKLLTKRLELVLSDAKAILANKDRDSDMVFLFGIMPFCVLTGRIDVLKDVLESADGISSFVKDEAERFVD